MTEGTRITCATVRVSCRLGTEDVSDVSASRACSVWSNFEIASMDFWRGEAYSQYFEYLDSKGGFYYEVSPALSIPTLSAHSPSHSAGATRRCTRSQPRCSRRRTRSSSSTRLGTSTTRTHTVRGAPARGSAENATARCAAALTTTATAACGSGTASSRVYECARMMNELSYETICTFLLVIVLSVHLTYLLLSG